jgi:hypothetical protein
MDPSSPEELSDFGLDAFISTLTSEESRGLNDFGMDCPRLLKSLKAKRLK